MLPSVLSCDRGSFKIMKEVRAAKDQNRTVVPQMINLIHSTTVTVTRECHYMNNFFPIEIN